MLLADSNEIGTFITDRLTPMVSLYTLTDNIAVRQLALWDLYAVRLVSIRGLYVFICRFLIAFMDCD